MYFRARLSAVDDPVADLRSERRTCSRRSYNDIGAILTRISAALERQRETESKWNYSRKPIIIFLNCLGMAAGGAALLALAGRLGVLIPRKESNAMKKAITPLTTLL